MLNRFVQNYKNNKAKQEQIFAKIKFWKVFWLGLLLIIGLSFITEKLPREIEKSSNFAMPLIWLYYMFKTRNNIKKKMWFYIGFYGVILLNVVTFIVLVNL